MAKKTSKKSAKVAPAKKSAARRVAAKPAIRAGGKPQIGRHSCDDDGGDRAPVETVVLHDQRRAAPRWF